MLFDPADLARFERVLLDRLGILCDAQNHAQVVETLAARAVAAGGSAAEVLARLAAPATARAELRAVAETMTVGETYFFRGQDHWRAFVDGVLPARLRAQAQTRRLRLLSAGCSSGEEPYTLAMLLREQAAESCAGWDLEVRGIDVNPAQLEKAARGRYTAWSLRDLPEGARARWFEEQGRELRVKDEVRALVRFEERNLLEDDGAFWRPGGYDVIFCRNVLIYFAPAAIQTVIARMQRALAPGGFLFLGHSETLRGVSHELRLISDHGTFYYQAPDGESAGPQPPPPAVADDWAGAIGRSARRISALSAPVAGPAPTKSAPAAPASGLDKALDLIRAERFAEAAALLSALAPDADTLRALAAVLLNLGRGEEAAAACRELRLAGGHRADACYLDALAREQAGDRGGAAARAHTAASLDRSFAMPHILLGRAARRAGDRESARRAFNRALELLGAEDPRRVLLYAGGFGREALAQMCRAELAACGSAA